MSKMKIKDFIALKEKNIKLLNKIYDKLNNDLKNSNKDKDKKTIKYKILVTFYTIYKEMKSKIEVSKVYKKNKNYMVFTGENDILENGLKRKLYVLNIYLNNTEKITQILKYGTRDKLMEEYNFTNSDTELIEFMIKNYKIVYDNEKKR